MSGLGRRSHYRKNVTDSVLNAFPEPNFAEGERIAQVAGSRGGNILEILVAASPDNNDNTSTPSSQLELALLPTKFRKLIWVKRGDFLIVGGDETTAADEQPINKSQQHKVRYMVRHILYSDQIKHLKSLKSSIWPSQFDDKHNNDADLSAIESLHACKKQASNTNIEQDSFNCQTDESSTDEYLEQELFVNTNRLAKLHVDDDEDDDSTSSNDEDQ
mmetsp:Transcript_3665/g.5471  ORF Transcript_3665/g.5471 Transcript_3665/m.5471 type:complete len:217 (-) Transcript_3665:70-720(-)